MRLRRGDLQIGSTGVAHLVALGLQGKKYIRPCSFKTSGSLEIIGSPRTTRAMRQSREQPTSQDLRKLRRSAAMDIASKSEAPRPSPSGHTSGDEENNRFAPCCSGFQVHFRVSGRARMSPSTMGCLGLSLETLWEFTSLITQSSKIEAVKTKKTQKTWGGPR